MSTLTQFLGGKPRRQIVTLTASNASLPIPAFAQGGKGVVYVTGCGGGGSGGIQANATNTGGGGGAGANSLDHPVPIPSGQTTLNATIGAGGSAISGTATADGNDGGSTSVVCGTSSLVLGGGQGGRGVNTGGQGGIANPGTVRLSATPVMTGSVNAGTPGNGGSVAGVGAGASSPFGKGGNGLASTGGANNNGQDATGRGAAGSGANYVSGGAVTSGAGAPGLLILEFVEGV